MWDLLYVVIMIGLVSVSAAFVIGCDKIIGPDDTALAEQGEEEEEAEGDAEPVRVAA